MKRKQLLAANIIGIILVIFIIAAGKISYSLLINSLSESIPDSQTIGIIGGADAPTAIFISGDFDLSIATLLLLLPLLLIGIIFIFNAVFLKKNQDKTTD